MSQTAYLGSPAMSAPARAAPAAEARPAQDSRFRCRDESLCGLAWLVAIAGTFLLIGGGGMMAFEKFEPITFSGRAGMGAVDNEATDVSMAELLAEAEVSQVNPTEEIIESLEVPESVEVPLEMQDLPELTEALNLEDVFTVPAAPKIETALKPTDPVKAKPVAARPRSTPAASTVAAPRGTEGSGGGAGGGGRIGSGGGKGKVPTPPYPSGARSRRVTGVLTFNLHVSPAGRVEQAAVVSSNCDNGGFTASEQSQIASYICRNWSLPGRMGSLRLPVRFQLR